MSVQRQTFNPPSQDGDTNASYMGSLNRPSVHVFNIVNNIAALGEAVNLDIPCNFPVREIIIRANYAISCASPDSYYATCNCPAFANGDVIAGFNGSICYDSLANDFTLVGSFNQSTMRYLLRQPMILQGTWQWYLHGVFGNVPTAADIILDFEFLG